MIVEWEQLPSLAGQVVMVDGSFDPLHEGHIAYFRAAEDFGKPVLCNIAPDEWTSRKHPILLPQRSRAAVIDALRAISYVHCGSVTSSLVLETLRPAVYAKGADWLARGGIPQQELRICEQHGIRIEYLDTVLNSSTDLIKRIQT